MLIITNFRSLKKNNQLTAKIDYKRDKLFEKFIRYWVKFNKIFFITDDYLFVASAT